ncbi:MAG: tyrosine-type recombinase/integrase [Pseudomonadota bacterium]
MPTSDSRQYAATWNTGFKIGPEKAFQAKEVWEIRFHLQNRGLTRYRALFDLGIDSKLRGCDLVEIRIGDVAAGGEIRKRTTVIQQKTGRPVRFEITETARESLTAWLDIRGGAIDDFLFPSRLARCPHLGTRQYARLVNEWVEAIGLPPEEYGTHSLRRTKASLIYKKTGNLRAVQILLGHTKIESTVRYLGVDVEDALSLAEGTDV